MKQVTDQAALSAAISACFRPGMTTNCTLSGDTLRELVDRGALLSHRWPGGLLLAVRQEDSFCLYYYLTDPAIAPAPLWPDSVVLEIPHRPRDGGGSLAFWEALGFVPVFTRLRLQRPADSRSSEPLPPPDPVEPEEADELLHCCFDYRTAFLPSREELAGESRSGCLLTRRDEAGQLCAILRALPGRRIVELRQLAARPDCQGQGLADSLAREFVRRFGGGLTQVWVREDFPAPRHIYEKNGFRPDGWTSDVLIRKG